MIEYLHNKTITLKGEIEMKIIKKKFLIHILLICFILCSISAITVLCINSYVKNSVSYLITDADNISPNNKYDCILVLGCGILPDGTPSSMLSDRLQRAIELYKSGAAPKIIMSGDHGRTAYDEVNTMRDYAINQGVAKEDIFMDHAGFSTYESMYRAKEIFCVNRMIVVTQKYHLYRALYICNNLGIDSIGVDSDYRFYYGQTLRDLREIAARCKDFVKCIFEPEPTFLGEVIPVSGDGTITCD